MVGNMEVVWTKLMWHGGYNKENWMNLREKVGGILLIVTCFWESIVALYSISINRQQNLYGRMLKDISLLSNPFHNGKKSWKRCKWKVWMWMWKAVLCFEILWSLNFNILYQLLSLYCPFRNILSNNPLFWKLHNLVILHWIINIKKANMERL